MSSWHKLSKRAFFFSQHRKDFWLSCMGVEEMWCWWGGHPGTCSSEIKTIPYFISVLFIYALMQRDTKGIHTQKNYLLTTPVREKSWFPNADEWILSEHKNVAHPTVHIDIKSALDYVLWHMSQSMKGPNLWTFFNFVHSISQYFSSVFYFCLLNLFEYFSVGAFWFSCSSLLKQPMIWKSIKKSLPLWKIYSTNSLNALL